jgi:hypothetical protein
MKKIFFSLLIVGMLATLFTSTVLAGYTISATLYAGQNEVAGFVKIWNDVDNLYVQIQMKGGAGWCLNKSQVHVATSLGDIPQNKNGNPKPGQFDYKGSHGCSNGHTYVIPLESGWRDSSIPLFIAVHTVVTGPDGVEETGWAVRCGNLGATQFPGANWAAYLVFTPDAWN